MGEYGFLALLIVLSTVWGVFWWWLLWRIAASKALAGDHLLRRILRGIGLFLGIVTPVGAVLSVALFLYF